MFSGGFESSPERSKYLCRRRTVRRVIFQGKMLLFKKFLHDFQSEPSRRSFVAREDVGAGAHLQRRTISYSRVAGTKGHTMNEGQDTTIQFRL